MKLVLALGNPENRFQNTRHNIGFWVLDSFSAKSNARWIEKSKFSALISEVPSEDDKVILAKPTTYYNLVGESYQKLIDFYKINPEDTLVIHDDLALPFGTIRTRQGGSGGGNNGIKSINQFGGELSARLRIGVANELLQKIGDTDFVLGKFSKEENQKLDKDIVPKAIEIIENFVFGDHQITSHRL